MLYKLSQHDIISKWESNKSALPMVSIVCHTYNHEKFIEESLQSFLSQKTSFPFEVIIHDDASTDNTQDIIKQYVAEYPAIFKPILQVENKHSQKIIIWSNYTFPKASGKYIAICEGDDYWTDELKLQKQVDFLEQNPEYVISWTNFVSYDGTKFIENDFETKFPELLTIDFNNVFSSYNTYSLTTVFRKDALNLNDFVNFKYNKDNTLFSLILKNGRGVFMNFKSAVYRWHEGGVFSLQSNFFKNHSSFLNVKEIYDTIDEAKTDNIKNVWEYLYREAAFEALKLYCSGNEITLVQNQLMKDYFKSASFKAKFKFIKKYFIFKFSSSN